MTKSEAIAELVRIWHSPHLDLMLKARLGEVIDTLKGEPDFWDEDDYWAMTKRKGSETLNGVDGDLIRREDAIDAWDKLSKRGRTEFDQVLMTLPSAEPKIYGNEHNCVLTMFGECSYNRSGCGSCEIVDKIREAINAEPKTGRWTWDDKGYFYCDQCGKKPDDQTRTTDYCPNCGTRMLEEDGEKHE